MPSTSKHFRFPIIFVTVFIDLLGIGILIPVIPLLLADPTSPEYLLPPDVSLRQGYILLGFLVATYPFFQFIAAPILGQLSDKFGRRPVLLFSLLGTALSYVLFATAIIQKNIPLLFASRAFDGITGGNLAVSQAAVADISTPANRAKSFGIMGAAFGLGLIIGPALGGFLSSPAVLPWFDAATPFWFAAALSFFNALSVWLIFPETHPRKNRLLRMDWGRSLRNIARAYTYKDLRPVFLTVFLWQGGFAFFMTFASVFFIERFGFTQTSIGNYFAYMGLWIAFTQLVLIRLLAPRFREHAVIRVTLPAVAVLVAVHLLPAVWWWLLLIAPLLAFSNGLSHVFLSTLVSRSVSAEIQGEILGILASVQALATSVPPVLSGFTAAALQPSSSIMVASIGIFCAALVFLFFFKPLKHAYAEE